MEEEINRVECDLNYPRHGSLGFDLSIIFRTVMVVFGDEKAY